MNTITVNKLHVHGRLDFPPCLIDFNNNANSASGAHACVSWARPKLG